MATYKVIQDIEAEDKLLGPLTLRQFVYAAIVVVMGFIAFKLGQANWLLTLPFLPPIIFFATLAAPFGHDQSNEVWLLAKIRFFLKPRRRIWDQSGLKELVTITVPKHIERQLTKGFNQDEVRSRLQALANTIDSRGWAVKNVNVNLFSQPSYVLNQLDSDRLIDPSTIPQEVPAYDVGGVNDIMDEQTSPTAQHIDQMITASAQTHRQEAIQRMGQAGQPASTATAQDYWFLNQPDPASVPAGYAVFSGSQTVHPGATNQPVAGGKQTPTVDEEALLSHIHKEKAKSQSNYHHLKTIDPPGAGSHRTHQAKPAATSSAQPEAKSGATAPHDPAILELAKSDDLDVATLARQAKKSHEQPPDEVVISLH